MADASEQKAQPMPMPTASLSYLPFHTGDGYSFGGGAIVTFDGTAIQFGEGAVADKLVKQVVAACNGHDALIDLAANVGGFDDSLLQTADLNVIRAALREFRDQARNALTQAGAA